MPSLFGSRAADLLQKGIVLGLAGGTGFLFVSISSQVYTLYGRRKESEAQVKEMLRRGEITQQQIDEALRSKGKKPISAIKFNALDETEKNKE